MYRHTIVLFTYVIIICTVTYVIVTASPLFLHTHTHHTVQTHETVTEVKLSQVSSPVHGLGTTHLFKWYGRAVNKSVDWTILLATTVIDYWLMERHNPTVTIGVDRILASHIICAHPKPLSSVIYRILITIPLTDTDRDLPAVLRLSQESICLQR